MTHMVWILKCDMDLKVHGMIFFLSASESKYRKVGETNIGIKLKGLFLLQK